MTNRAFSCRFRHVTQTAANRVNHFERNGITISEYNTISYPYHLLKSIDTKKHNLKSSEHLINYYLFKQAYFSLILKYILHVENSLKESISYIVGVNYGDNTYVNNSKIHLANDYLNPSYYTTTKNKDVVETILKNLKKKIVNPPSYCENIRKFRNETNLPPYILAHDLMFSAIIDWYYILNTEDSINVMQFILQKEILESERKIISQFFLRALRLLKETRNNYAHNNSDGKYDEDNYKGISYKSLGIIFPDNIFKSSISKNKYEKYVKKSPQSVANICLLILLDPLSKEKFINEFIILFENDCSKIYKLNSSKMKDDLQLNEFYTLIENMLYDKIENEDRLEEMY